MNDIAVIMLNGLQQVRTIGAIVLALGVCIGFITHILGDFEKRFNLRVVGGMLVTAIAASAGFYMVPSVMNYGREASTSIVPDAPIGGYQQR
ncbi:hypothetical protein [Nocardia brasiliensis]|uniref:hypothetical protein n=1 Tax=Nocardia brasiliensis TaxID=37326 RepID=UPI002458ED05|nr:hypothetical protein [Nocardia brasiliensis]